MKILMIACSKKAYDQMKKLACLWRKKDPGAELLCAAKYQSMSENKVREDGFLPVLDCSVQELVGRYFDRVDVILFHCAAAIAVRSIAPFLGHKSTDPAVLAADETGKFCISLLSGHMGGANEITLKVSEMLGAVPVITTATDCEGKFAVDILAKKNDLLLQDFDLAKRISAAVLEGGKVWIYSELPFENTMTYLPDELIFCENAAEMEQKVKGKAFGVWISYHKRSQENSRILQLIPRVIVAGIGCRKDAAPEKTEAALAAVLQKENILPEALKAVASIDRKSNERGITELCDKRNLPFLTFSAEELKKIKGSFSASPFVEEITGVENVCERSALCAAGEQGKLICKKEICDGVTIALAEVKRGILF